MTSTPPPDYIASIRLRVPAELAFRTIANLESQSWNTFTPKITPKTASTTGSVFEGDPSDVPLYPVDTPITIRVETLLPFPIIQRERITRWDVSHREIAWSQAVLPRWLLWTDRTQKVDEHEDGRGGGDYVTTMTFRGPLAPVVRFFMGHRIKLALDRVAHDLQTELER